jgi:superfamily II DNA helicase RecQ
MDQFTHLPEYRVIICKKCQYAVLPSEIDAHFQKMPTHGLSKKSRRRIQEQVAKIHGLIQSQHELQRDGFTFPPPRSPAMPELGMPKTDGLRCTFDSKDGKPCQFINRRDQMLREHYRDIHDWVNPRKRGGQSKKVPVEETPWRKEVHCQRFFDHGLYSRYFEVQSQPPEASTETPEEKIQKLIQGRIDHAKEEQRKKIEVMNEAQQPDSWLRKVRWHRHLEGKDPDKLRTLIRPVDEEGEEMLAVIHASFHRIIDACHQHATAEVVGESALCKVNAVEYGKKTEDPFYMEMKDNTRLKYRNVWLQITSFIIRAETKLDEKERPDYRLTGKQKKSFKALTTKAIAFQDVEVKEEGMSINAMRQMTELDRECLQFHIELLDHQLPGDEYENAIISGLSILGIREGGGWVPATEYTTNYSAIVKLARALVIEHAYQTRGRQIEAAKLLGYDDDQARRDTESHYELVRKMVDRFMGLEGGRREPTPMDWIISKRSYGMRIRFTTTANGTVQWIGDKIIYKSIEFNMTQLRIMVHTVIANARMELMRDLMMIPLDDVGDINEGQVPSIDWPALRDNMAENKVGWSFLDDIRNPFSVDDQWWLFKRIFQDPQLKRRFVQSEEPIRWRRTAMEEFEQHLVNVQELLLFICHFTGGPPSRGPEILSVRHRNTANGGLRNIGIENGLMFFTPRTHKNFMQRGTEKIVHHFLSQEGGEILMYYLWLVLPFWEKVQISVDENAQFSPFLWGGPAADMRTQWDEEKEDVDGEEQEEDGQDESPGDVAEEAMEPESYTKVGAWYHDWTSERLSRIIRREGVKAMDAKLGNSSWRNIVEAISVRFLRRPFEFDRDDEWKDEVTEWWAEMFGHSAAMGEDMYGRLLTEVPGERGSSRAKNRYISQEWHQFLKFPSAAQGLVQPPKSFHDEASRMMQIQRHNQMRDANIQHELEKYIGQGAQFRAEQKQAITAVMSGKSPVFVVMATSAGKSMVFMLPAFYAQGGTTVVVVPLTSLQGDLKRRCDESGISCSIWRSGRAIEAASIILVTPESALTKGFRDYINLLRATHRLDRIVFEECHTVLASRPNFRPQMRRLGVLVRLNVQVVFITATLRPRDEPGFFQTMNIIGKGIQYIRGRTSRRNIRYQIRRYESRQGKGSKGEDSSIQAVVELVGEMKIKYPAPAKIIVYSSRKKFADALSEELGCMLYHADVSDRQGKDERLKKWMQGHEDSRVVVATNALGLGIDVGDTRVVIHAQMPKDLADYVQESGRAGRDGAPSESIVLLPVEVPDEEPGQKRRRMNSRIAGQPKQPGEVMIHRHKNDKPATMGEEEMAAEIDDFIGAKCRRVVLDRVMDGRYDRIQCEEGEEACDMCQEFQHNIQVSRNRDEFLAALEEDEHAASPIPTQGVGIINQDQVEFEQQESQMSWIDFHAREVNQEEAYEVEELGRQLQRFKNRCPWCYVNGREENTQHSFEHCSIYNASGVRQSCREFIAAIQDERTMELYSCCTICFVPQAICQHWIPKAEDGRWKEDQTKDCQFKGIIIEAFWCMVIKGQERTMGWLRGWSSNDGYNIDDNKGCLAWLGKKVEWGGIEANKLIQAFLILAKDIPKIEEI